MARLIRMDARGHTTLAEWTAADDAQFACAVDEFRSQQQLGYIGAVMRETKGRADGGEVQRMIRERLGA